MSRFSSKCAIQKRYATLFSDDEKRKSSTSQQEPKKKRGRRGAKAAVEADAQTNGSYVGDIQSLPPEIWMHILRRSCVRENGVVEMCSVIKCVYQLLFAWKLKLKTDKLKSAAPRGWRTTTVDCTQKALT